MNVWPIRMLTVVSLALGLGGEVAAQSQAAQAPAKKEETLAEAARRARAARERKGTVAQPAREFTNDNLPPVRFPGGESTSTGDASAPATPASGAAADSPDRPAPTAEDEQQRASAEAAVREEKAKLDTLRKELELMERETRLNKESFYKKPDFAGDSAGAAAIAAQDAAIASKKSEVTAAEAKVAEAEEKLRAISDRLGPKPQAPQTPEAQRNAWAEKLRPLRDELAKIDAELATIQQERAALGSSASNPPGAFTGDRVQQLERRRAELQRQIGDIEDDARRAGTLPIRN